MLIPASFARRGEERSPGSPAGPDLVTLGVTLVPLLCALGLTLVGELDERPWRFYVLIGIWSGSLLVVAARFRRSGVTTLTLLGVAVVLRILLVPLPPGLSNDVFRYLWDGHVAAAGFNPYALAPETDLLEPLRTGPWQETWASMSHRDVETVYPPLAIGLFSIASRLPAPLYAYKLLLVLIELFGCWLLVRVAARWELPRWRTLLYLWNPLVVVEVAGMGHVDGAGLAAMAGALLLLGARPSRPAWAGLAAAAGVLIKLVPVVVLPGWARASSRPARFLFAALFPLVAVALPVLWWTGGVPPGLIEYGVSWEYNGPVYEPLWRLIDRAGVAPAVKDGLAAFESWTGHHELLEAVYPFVYPQLLAKLLLALGLMLWILLQLRVSDPLRSAASVLAGASLAVATFYPWYLLWLLPWAALLGWWSWWVASLTLPLAYLPSLFGLKYFPWVYLSIWLPPLAVALWARRRGGGGVRGSQ